jgi:hypothetical protein
LYAALALQFARADAQSQCWLTCAPRRVGEYMDTAMYISHITSRRQIETEPPKRLTPAGFGSGDIDARDVKAQEAAEGCAEYERPQEHRQYR